MRKITIVNRKKFMLSLIVITITFLGLFFSVYAAINNVESTQEENYIQVYVKSGDTVWKIAKEFTSNDIDIRTVVYEIGQINKLKDYNIFPGQIIKIPVDLEPGKIK